MYNRYIPQADGSFRRNTVADPVRRPPRPEPPREERPCPPEPQPPQSCQSCPQNRPAPPPPPRPRKQQPPVGIGSFFKKLIPKGFDTEDLIIVLLLILMAGDCQEDQNTALLTLALYLFL